MKNSYLLAISVLFAVACKTTAPPPSAPSGAPRSLHEVPTVSRSIDTPVIRVGLETDQSTIAFPRIEGGYYLLTEKSSYMIDRGFTMTAPLAGAASRYAVQVAAVSDQESARRSAEKIRSDVGVPADVVFDARGGVFRILAGSFEDEASARPLRQQLADAGYPADMFITKRPSTATFQRNLRLVDDEGGEAVVASPSVLVLPAKDETIRIGSKVFRGGARLFINDRGLVNAINELNLEDYVRGVVPNEMGPKVFDELEALKAQAMAARTYAVKRMGDFGSEGYDICPTPACQVYEGYSSEAELSDQAVRDTAGKIITHDGSPIDALYTSTCGGQTSDVSVMFPTRSEPYLKGVRDVELKLVDLEGRAAESGLMDLTRTQALLFSSLAGLQPSGSWAAKDVVEGVGAAARLGGMPSSSAAPPKSSRRGDVLGYLARVWNLSETARALTLPESRRYFFPRSGDDSDPYLAAAFLIKYGILPSQSIDTLDLSAPMPRDELYALLYSWLQEHEAVTEAGGKVLALSGRKISLKAGGKVTSFLLPAAIPLIREIQDRYQEYRSLPVMIGDRATLVQDQSGRPVALILKANYDGAAFDRTSSFANWTRSYRADDLVKSISRRNAIKSLAGLRVLSVDDARRVKELEVTAEGGRTFVLKGLPIRWSLNVPDNLFVISKTKDADGMDRYTFFGKGWGHGVGMCQVGAYGMAFAGYDAEQIIRHYYTGVQIVSLGEVKRGE